MSDYWRVPESRPYADFPRSPCLKARGSFPWPRRAPAQRCTGSADLWSAQYSAPAQALIVHAHISQDLRGKLALGIEAFGFFLKMDAAQVQAPYAGRHVGVGFSLDPAKAFA